MPGQSCAAGVHYIIMLCVSAGSVKLRRGIGDLVAVAMVCAAWYALTGVTQHAIRSGCATMIDQRCTAAKIMQQDPYCLFDPTCVSPGLKSNTNPDGSTRHWEGFRVVGDPLLVYGNPITMLALPNYVVFAATVCALLMALRTAISRFTIRRRMTMGVGVFAILEVARWYYSAWQLSELTAYPGFVLDPVTYLVLGVMALPMGLTIWWTL